jgi:putative acetyltransferase
MESGKEVFIIGEIDGGPGGFGSVLPELGEFRSLYVDAAFTRKGLGSAILRRLEEIAAVQGVRQLHLNSSLNAEPFYLAQGYEPMERSLHQLSGGMVMACVKMTKTLSAVAVE